MPIRIIAQPFTSCRPEAEPTAETVTLEPDANGDFSHKLLGPITIETVKEVKDGATISIRFDGSFNTDVWPCGDQSSSFLLKALAQTLTKAYVAGGQLPPEFPQSVTLADVFLRRGNTPMELSIMTKPDGSDGPWQKLSDIQLSYAPDLQNPTL